MSTGTRKIACLPLASRNRADRLVVLYFSAVTFRNGDRTRLQITEYYVKICTSNGQKLKSFDLNV